MTAKKGGGGGRKRGGDGGGRRGRRPEGGDAGGAGEKRSPRGRAGGERRGESPEERTGTPRGRGRAADRGTDRGASAAGGRRSGGSAGAKGAERGGAGARQRPRPAGGSPPEELRLQTFLARAGVASRRASEELIREGRVTIDGERAEIGARVRVARDQVRVDGALVELQRVEWVALNKPSGYVTTRDDPRGRKTVYDLIPDELHHLFHVGRLDRESTGLLLLTNDGEAANRLLHPRYGTSKEYWADIEEEPTDETLQQLVKGVRLEDGIARALSARPLGETDAGTFRVEIVLEEGRNREVRRMLEAVGHPVLRLTRRRFGPIELGKLRPGHWRHLTRNEIDSLRVRE